MKRLLIAVAAAVSAATGVVHAGADAGHDVVAAKARLLEGVSAIDVGGGAIPGPLLLTGEGEAFPLALCENYDGTRAFAAAAAFYGKGRLVYLGHPAYLDKLPFLADTAALLRNSVKWLSKDAAEVRVAALRNGKIAAALRELGFKNVREIKKLSDLAAGEVLVANGLGMAETADALKFVGEGGGLAMAGLGWGFKYFNKNANFAEDFPDNRILAPAGILMGDSGSNRIGGVFPAAAGAVPRGVCASDALELAKSWGEASAQVKKQCAWTLSMFAEAMPASVATRLAGKFQEVAAATGAEAVPSPARPLGAESIFARIAVSAKKNAWLAAPERLWPAEPSAAVYPGLVKPGTPAVERDVDIDLTVPRWHSTGLFAAAGAAVSFKIDADAAKLGLKARIGSTADNLSSLQEWKRAPLVTVEVPLTKEETTFSSPYGGLVYVVVPRSLKGAAKVRVSGCVMAPWFVSGRDTAEKFARECAETGAPYGEIQGRDFIITAETEGLKQVSDPGWIADYWDRVLAADAELACMKGPRESPERICPDVQLVMGWMHNGYPLMTHVNDNHLDWAIDRERMEKGDVWGVCHEIGHNHQSGDWTPEGTGEVTVNLFTCFAIETVAGANIRESRFQSGAGQSRKRVAKWVAGGKKFDEWKKDPFLALEVYLRIKEVYGWAAYKKVFGRYREPGFKRPPNDAEKWNTFARELTAATGHDMAAALAAWSIPLSEETLKSCAKNPPADDWITKGLIRKSYVGPRTEPVLGEYMGVSLAGADAGEITMYATKDEVPGGDSDVRWKTSHLLLRRIEPTDGLFEIGRRGAPTNAWDAGREIEISKPYYFGVYEITQEQWYNVMESWKSGCFGGKGDRETRPVNGVSYVEMRGRTDEGVNWPATGRAVSRDSFLGRLREMTGNRAEFDLPTEAQWEYAARAGTTGKWNSGEEPEPYKRGRFSCDKVLDGLGRYCGNGGEPDDAKGWKPQFGVKGEYGTAPVGSYRPNAWGIYDTHGNVYEYCLDWWRPASNPEGMTGKDPAGPASSGDRPRRVMRGGGWWNASFGSPDAAANWSRGLGNLCDPGIGHTATGFRIAVDAAVAAAPQPLAGDEPLPAAAAAARAEILRGVGKLATRGLPGPVYCFGTNAFPLVAAKTWEGDPAAVAAAAFHGRGRVVLVADSDFAPSPDGPEDNRRFIDNAKKWLSNGGANVVMMNLDEAPDMSDAEIARIATEVETTGGGILFFGRAWPWRQRMAAERGHARVADWPGNRLLAAFGLAVGDFCVARTADGGFSTRRGCEEGCAAAPSSFFEDAVYPKPAEPVIGPAVPDGGVVVRDGDTVAFLGDSITRLGANPGGYINLVMKGLAVAGVKGAVHIGAGIDGNNAGDMLGRVGRILSNPSVKVMTVSCGVNDVWGYEWGRGVMLEEYKRNVRAIYDKAAGAGVLVVAMTPTLIREDPSNEKNLVLDQFADFIRAEAKARGLPLADPRADEVAALARFEPDSGLHFTYDGVHPVQAGNVLIAKSVLRAMGVDESKMPAIEAEWAKMLE